MTATRIPVGIAIGAATASGDSASALTLMTVGAISEFDGRIAEKKEVVTNFGDHFDMFADSFYLLNTMYFVYSLIASVINKPLPIEYFRDHLFEFTTILPILAYPFYDIILTKELDLAVIQKVVNIFKHS